MLGIKCKTEIVVQTGIADGHLSMTLHNANFPNLKQNTLHGETHSTSAWRYERELTRIKDVFLSRHVTFAVRYLQCDTLKSTTMALLFTGHNTGNKKSLLDILMSEEEEVQSQCKLLCYDNCTRCRFPVGSFKL